jgi:hypothetical protein
VGTSGDNRGRRSLRPVEEWARRCIASALNVDVGQHDDQSEASMFDLEVVRGGTRAAAIEVTSATDENSTRLWNTINPPGNRWIARGLVGGWVVGLRPDAQIRGLRAEVLRLVRGLESAGRGSLSHPLAEADSLDDRADRLGIGRLTSIQRTSQGVFMLSSTNRPIRPLVMSRTQGMRSLSGWGRGCTNRKMRTTSRS